MIIADRRENTQGCSISTFGSNSIPTETKNNTEKASLSGKDSWAARWLKVGLSHHHSGKKSAKSEGNTEEHGGTVSDAYRYRDDTQDEEFGRIGAGDVPKQPGKNPFSNNKHQGNKDATLPNVSRRVVTQLEPETSTADPPCAPSHPESGGNRTSTRTIARSSTTSQPDRD